MITFTIFLVDVYVTKVCQNFRPFNSSSFLETTRFFLNPHLVFPNYTISSAGRVWQKKYKCNSDWNTFYCCFFLFKIFANCRENFANGHFYPTSSLEKNGYFTMFHFHISFKYETRLAWCIRSARATLFLRLKLD